MAKININFNNTTYSIDESSLAAPAAELKSHLSTAMSGTGAMINLGGVEYSVDSTKLSTARDGFVSRLGVIAGSDSKIIVGGAEYGIDANKVSGAVAGLHATLGELEAGGGEEEVSTIPAGTYRFNDNLVFDGFGLEFVKGDYINEVCVINFGDIGDKFSLAEYTFTPDVATADYINQLAIEAGVEGDVVAGTTYTINTCYHNIEIMKHEVKNGDQVSYTYTVSYYFSFDDKAHVSPYSNALISAVNWSTGGLLHLDEVYMGSWQSTRLGGSYQTITIPNCTLDGSKASWFVANTTKQDATSFITFTIDGTSCQAEEGMTWEEWVDSSYNTDSYWIQSTNLVVTSDSQDGSLGGEAVSYDGSMVSASDVISTLDYSLLAFGGSGN